MKLQVKILQGAECNIEIVGEDSVDRLKELIEVDEIECEEIQDPR